MNNKNELKKLTVKYFWQQKTLEVLSFIGGIVAIIFIPYLLGILTNIIFKFPEGYVSNHGGIWTIGLMFVLILVLIGLLIYVIYRAIEYWISENWEKAEKRAKLKLNYTGGKNEKSKS